MGEFVVVASLVTADEVPSPHNKTEGPRPKPHPNKLDGEGCNDGVFTLKQAKGCNQVS